MLQNISLAWSLATFPVRTLSKGYRALAWAFDAPAAPERPRAGLRATGAEAAAGNDAVELLPASARERLLKLGFVSSTLLWAPAAYAAIVAHNLNWVSEQGAWMGFAWTAAAIWVLSVLAIRRAGKKQAAAHAASPLFRARRAVGESVAAAVDMPRRIVNGVREAPARLVATVRAAPAQAACAATCAVKGVAGRVACLSGKVLERGRSRLTAWLEKRAPLAVTVPSAPPCVPASKPNA